MPEPQRLVWDNAGERVFQTGVDRGVLYLRDGTFAAWNGLTSVESGSAKDLKSFFLDGVKYLEKITPGEYSGKLKAITYPDEFDRALGIVDSFPGLEYHDQIPEYFSLTYRTLIGNDVSGTDFGYKIHLLYNLVADPDTVTHQTLGESPDLSEFAWGLSGIPQRMAGHRPTVHISIDSTKINAGVLSTIEDLLYGSDTNIPQIPSLTTLEILNNASDALIILDQHDGTWLALDVGNNYISMLDASTFEIDDADVVIIDSDVYTISTTNFEE